MMKLNCMTQKCFIIPDDCEWANAQLQYAENQAQLQMLFDSFAERIGLETRDATIRLWDIGIIPTENDRKKFRGSFHGPIVTWWPYTLVNSDSKLLREWHLFLREADATPIAPKGFRHLSSDRGRDTYFQSFRLHGFTYGAILASQDFELDGQVSEISASLYYSELAKYLLENQECPRFEN